MVDSVGGVGAWVVSVFYDGVAPGPRAEDVPDVGDRVAEGVALFDCREGVAEAAACPGGALLEEGFHGGDGFLERFVECVDGWAVRARGGWDRSDVVGYEVG